MRKLFKERKLFQGGNYMRKYGMSKEMKKQKSNGISDQGNHAM